MSRYDKYDPMTGGFRAPLAANFGYTASLPDKAHADLGKTFAVALTNAGLVVKLATTATAFAGIMILTRPMAAGDIVDVMTDGEIVELADAEVGGAALGPGSPLFADPTINTGLLTTTSATGLFYVGRTVEMPAIGARAIIRCGFRAV